MNTQSAAEPVAPRTFRITGFVRFAGGVSAPRIKVVAFDRDLRSEERLGEAQTDREGAYRIEYAGTQFLNRERGTADLVVKALDADGSILIASPVLFNARQDAKTDLAIPLERQRPPELFLRIESAVGPLLGHVKVEELEENQEHQDLTLLSGKTGFAKGVLARFVLARSLASLGIDRELWFALLGGSLFEHAEKKSLKENLAAVTNALPTFDDRAARKALASTFNTHDIRPPARTDGRVGQGIPRTRRAACFGGTPSRLRSSERRLSMLASITEISRRSSRGCSISTRR
jgi:hypothetical protein